MKGATFSRRTAMRSPLNENGHSDWGLEIDAPRGKQKHAPPYGTCNCIGTNAKGGMPAATNIIGKVPDGPAAVQRVGALPETYTIVENKRPRYVARGRQ